MIEVSIGGCCQLESPWGMGGILRDISGTGGILMGILVMGVILVDILVRGGISENILGMEGRISYRTYMLG